MKYSEEHHFADTNLLNFNNYIKSNHDLKNRDLKISLNVDKTKVVLFTSPKKKLDSDLKIKLNGKRLVKYLGIQIDKSLTLNRLIMWLQN